MTRLEQIRDVFTRHDGTLTIDALVTHAIEAGIFTPGELATRDRTSLQQTCRQAVRALALTRATSRQRAGR